MTDPTRRHPGTDDRIDHLEERLKLIERYSVEGFWKSIDAVYRVTTPSRRIHCIVCDHSGNATEFADHVSVCSFGGGELRRHGCPRCGCIFGPLKYLDLDEEFVDLDYRLLYSTYSEANSTESELHAFHSLQPRAGALFLDWGCGGEWSRTIEQLRGEGYEVWGYEPSARVSSGFVVSNKDEISATFDGIFSNNVIEHFRDPVLQFKYFNSILKKGGKMAHQSPCYAYEYADTRFHTLFLLGDSPHVLAEKTGFKAERSGGIHDSINFVFTKVE